MEITILIIAVAIVLFLGLREFWTWYWKIEKIIQGQEMTNHLLRVLIKKQTPAEGAKSSDGSTFETSADRMPDLHNLPTQAWEPDVKKLRQQKRIGIILLSFGGVSAFAGVLDWIGTGELPQPLLFFALPFIIAGLVTFFQGRSAMRKFKNKDI